MTLYKFNKLSEFDQNLAIWEHGVLLARREEAHTDVFLFQISAFYVEVFFSREPTLYQSLKAFKSTNKLSVYLDAIDISPLVSLITE